MPTSPREPSVKIAGAVAVLLLLALTPGAMADHDPDYDDTSGAQALDDVATDGYIVYSEQVGNRSFDVQVWHRNHFGFGDDVVPLDEPGQNAGAWLHDHQDPLNGTHPAQNVSLSEDGETLRIRNVSASGVHSVVLVVPIQVDGQGWVAGFHNPIKGLEPYDGLDAVPFPVLF